MGASYYGIVNFDYLSTRGAFMVSRVRINFISICHCVAFAVFVEVRDSQVGVSVQVRLLGYCVVTSNLRWFAC